MGKGKGEWIILKSTGKSGESGGSTARKVPTAADYARGERFAAWLQDALNRKQWRPKTLCDEAYRLLGESMSPGYVGTLLKGGYREATHKVMQPSPDFVERVAAVTGADLPAGLASAYHLATPSALAAGAAPAEGEGSDFLMLPPGVSAEGKKVLLQAARMMAEAGKTAYTGSSADVPWVVPSSGSFASMADLADLSDLSDEALLGDPWQDPANDPSTLQGWEQDQAVLPEMRACHTASGILRGDSGDTEVLYGLEGIEGGDKVRFSHTQLLQWRDEMTPYAALHRECGEAIAVVEAALAFRSVHCYVHSLLRRERLYFGITDERLERLLHPETRVGEVAFIAGVRQAQQAKQTWQAWEKQQKQNKQKARIPEPATVSSTASAASTADEGTPADEAGKAD